MRESQSWNIYIDVRERFQNKNMIGYNFEWNYRNVEAQPHDNFFYLKKYIFIYLTSCQSLKGPKEKYLNKSHGTS